MKNWTPDTLKKLLEQGRIQGYTELGASKPPAPPAAKRSKYGAQKTEVNGMVFDSAREARRYQELLLLQKHGAIGLLRLQVPYELNPGGTHSLVYVADFVYRLASTGEEVVEDCKGYRTKEYRKKRRLMKQVHGITIKET